MEIRARYVLIGLFTLVVILGGFLFVYWLNNSAGFATRTAYRVEFDKSVSGLLRGSAVLFNGIRVGEVTSLGLNPAAPDKISVAIAVDPLTPIRADTTAELAFQGLTGTAAVALRGGAADAPPIKRDNGQVPLLRAAIGGGQDVTQAAREALQTFTAVLEENRDPVKGAIENINTFAAALARNADKIDGIVAGVEQLTGGGSAKANLATYDLHAPKDFAKTEVPTAQLAVAEPTSVVAFNSQKILLRREGDKMGAIDAGQWSDAVPALVQARMVQAFENAGYLSVGRAGDQFMADASLQIDIRDFTVASVPAPTANVELSAKILDNMGKIIAAKLFHATATPPSLDAAGASAGISIAFAAASSDMVAWAISAVPR